MDDSARDEPTKPTPVTDAGNLAPDDGAPEVTPDQTPDPAEARYAIYWTPPPDGPLSILGEQLFGPGRPALAKAIGVEAETLIEATEGPAHYGLHATLRAPFHLADGVAPESLGQAIADFAAQHGSVAIPEPELAELGPYLVLRPSRPASELDELAANVVQAFDAYRAPLTGQELERRRADGLTPRQAEHLQRWGYPYVFDTFRFHITLAGPCDGQTRTLLARALQPQLAPLLTMDWTLDALSLVTQPDRGSAFDLVERFPLAG
ncbi:DUF1045 domain-containing protein [Rhodovibrio salinarum]|uniref:DUF1045 domain-containing protein n=2 Tax=Rhodovibrio salinarum TaxID=1087 RepID=A0A934QLZ2_9PROT|nr:DUF1045 domain-containing protein [Rhodovibrio salinarum]MBK1699079.1 DUF1045 domain-containing protein [Rhodovibrio salinarum]